ncbi:DUF2330 domain-containing protein [Ktedonobacter racemifer]|uniref:DUF2330 domain-containing protein n=1 Tax=Ktedonobacter racemifer DSM 44963 TaxID=485913 RepID=D6U0N4_KTERA|nr:DUF2330 domain-containing protein [Ktedonobacter racemifer]EFH82374.1 Protein of unknown function DUF2330 [Ktedonobacter racemifer DSM 44963]
MLKFIRLLAPLSLALCCLLLLPASALACGGLFASTNQARVSQDTERLLITVGAHSTTLYEQIRYQGKAQDFAWVLPVPVVPSVDQAPQALFTSLEQLTAPRFVVPAARTCDYADITRPHYSGMGAGAPNTTSSSNVNVYGSGAVGPFAYDVIKSGDAGALTHWLQAHQYAVPASTQQFIQPYVAKNMYFLAMRLQAKADTTSIAPVKITFPMVMKQIMIPIRLAATDINTRMNMEVSILANERFAPQNYQDIHIDQDQITSTPNPGANYYQLIDTAIQKAGGYGFVTEYAQPVGPYALGSYLKEMPENAYLTRFYTSFTPDHMQIDPILAPKANLNPVSPYISLNYSSPPPDCTLTYVKSAACVGGAVGVPLLGIVAGAIWLRRHYKAARRVL